MAFLQHTEQRQWNMQPHAVWWFALCTNWPEYCRFHCKVSGISLIDKNWFYGPDFLEVFEFNTFYDNPALQNNLINAKYISIITKSKDYGSSTAVETNLTNYLSFPKLVRQVSWILKIKRNWLIWKTGGKERFTELNTNDANNDLETLVKITQNHSFPLEMSNLLSQRSINCQCKMLLLFSFIDEKNNKEYRVGGRLKNANANLYAKHRVILISITRSTHRKKT